MNAENTDDLSFLLITPSPTPQRQPPAPAPMPIVPIRSDFPFPPGSRARKSVVAWMQKVEQLESKEESKELKFLNNYQRRFLLRAHLECIQQALERPVWFASLFDEQSIIQKDRAARGAGS